FQIAIYTPKHTKQSHPLIMCSRGKQFPSVILAKQCTRTEGGIDICRCKYDQRDVSKHEKIINQGMPTKDSEPGYLRCPFILKDGQQCHATCQKSKPSGLVRHQERSEEHTSELQSLR